MTAYLVAEVWCDDCGRRETNDDGSTEWSVRDLRAYLKQRGWTMTKGLDHHNVRRFHDHCPDCKP